MDAARLLSFWLVALAFAGCAADASGDPTEGDAQQVVASDRAVAPAARARGWKLLNLGSRFTQRMTVRVDEQGNVTHACAGGANDAERQKP